MTGIQALPEKKTVQMELYFFYKTFGKWIRDATSFIK